MPAKMTVADRTIALFDLDDTLVDYQGQLLRDLQSIASPGEPPIESIHLYAGDIPYLEARRHVITSQVGWWRKLPRLQLGWDILEVAREIGYSIAVLKKGHRENTLLGARKSNGATSTWRTISTV